MTVQTSFAFDLVFVANQDVPRLAWLADIDRGRRRAEVTHGAWVEVFEGGFVEGVWDGPFRAAMFDQTPTVFGSGGVVRSAAMVFVSSTATTDYLYWAADEPATRVAVSNSLPMLLARLGDELDPQIDFYDEINASIMHGIERYTREIPTRKGKTIRRLMHRNLTVAPTFVSETPKPWPPDFGAYDDYAAYLHDSYGRLAVNARDGARRRPMAVCSTQSKGYDTTAANAVARQFGIDRVFTVTRAKATGYYADEAGGADQDDDGTEICAYFGLECIPIDRRSIERDVAGEYLFYASMHENGDLNFHEVGRYIDKPTALITGCLGEIWHSRSFYDEHPGLINSDLMRADLGNHGLTEVRLSAGYVQVPFPYIGARRRESIFRITHAPEMGPWRLNTAYDRPIARRLAEETGLPRLAFGQTKMASVLEFPFPVVPVGDPLRLEFLNFLVGNRLIRRWQLALLPLARRWNAIVWNTSPRRHAWSYYSQRLIGKAVGRPFAFPFAFARLNGAIFCFCVNRRIEDYRSARRPSLAGVE